MRLGFGEILVVLALALLFFGPRSFRSSAPAWGRPSRASRRASTRSRSPRRKRSFLRPR